MIILAGAWAAADGPWKGQIVDAETGRPLAGAIVLAAWWKRSPGAMHERTEFYEAHEVVADGEGRFVIPRVKTATFNPFTHVDGPDLKIFKAGYGQWRFRGEPPGPPSNNVIEWEAWRGKAWKRFASDGIALEVPPLKSKEERRQFRDLVLGSMIPPERTRQMTRALEEEDAWLGRRPAPRY